MGRADEGTQVFADLLKSSRVSQEAVDMVNSQWGNALMAKGDFAQAIERYKEVMRWPKSESGLATLAHLRTGQALDALGKRADAEAEYRTVLKLENVYDSRKQAEQYLKKPYAPTKD
jgi:Flp pilus assembly protein TadD